MRRLGFLTLLAIVGIVAAAIPAYGRQAMPPLPAPNRSAAEAGQPPSATGLIVGQVVDGATGKPVPEALVGLRFTPINPPTLASPITETRVMTDGEGRFFFPALAAGRYNLSQNKPGYIGGRGVQTRLLGTITPVDLADGERITDLKLPIWKYATIAGTVIDEAGEPVVGVTVRALRRSIVSGRPRFATGISGTTDDRGQYRLATLTPGDFIVVVPSTQTTFPAAALVSFFQGAGPSSPLQSEMSAAAAEITPLGMARTQQIGDVVLSTLNRMAIPPGPSGAGKLAVYQTTFYPSAVAPSEATVVSCGSGDERSGVNFQLRPVPAVRVSGTLVGPDGSIAPTALRLIPAAVGESMTDAGFETVTGLTQAGGAFTLLGVPAGQYVLSVLSPPPNSRSATLPSTPEKPVLWATESVTIGETDISDLSVTLRPTLRVTGRLEFHGAVPPANELEGLYVSLDPIAGGSVATTAFDANNRFVTGAPGGKYTFRAETPTGWMIKSITADGHDIADTPLDLKADTNVIFTLTDQPAQISGIVRDDKGAPATTALAILFPVDRQLWTGYGSFGWRVRSGSPSRAGAYAIEQVPPGEYFITVIRDATADNYQDPKTLEVLSRTAQRVTIGEGEKKTLDLKYATR